MSILYYKKASKSLKDFHSKKDGYDYLINLIKLLEHMDFLLEVTKALHIINRVLIVVDCKERVCIQMKIIQAIQWSNGLGTLMQRWLNGISATLVVF
uniref:Uncharacterized protein n=1 Tax=Physcomitrium patens TaxID=3218 RepID=A0A2K1L1W4_PHYPA|nr:hypothetical protein PHYPA_002798 [Physcomitrium patens]